MTTCSKASPTRRTSSAGSVVRGGVQVGGHVTEHVLHGAQRHSARRPLAIARRATVQRVVSQFSTSTLRLAVARRSVQLVGCFTSLFDLTFVPSEFTLFSRTVHFLLRCLYALLELTMIHAALDPLLGRWWCWFTAIGRIV